MKLGLAILAVGFFIFAVGAGLRAQWLPIRAGRETMMGKTVPALTNIDENGGKVFVEGEYWSAVSKQPIACGERVEIVDMEGLTLKVRRVAELEG